uniref:hypothetical protein n=1 Tax=Xanthomonas albilineans TaxID=29447 RepID=UPI0027DC5A26|nr:hypothetical protein [Xanthomonas albilineans]
MLSPFASRGSYSVTKAFIGRPAILRASHKSIESGVTGKFRLLISEKISRVSSYPEPAGSYQPQNLLLPCGIGTIRRTSLFDGRPYESIASATNIRNSAIDMNQPHVAIRNLHSFRHSTNARVDLQPSSIKSDVPVVSKVLGLIAGNPEEIVRPKAVEALVGAVAAVRVSKSIEYINPTQESKRLISPGLVFEQQRIFEEEKLAAMNLLNVPPVQPPQSSMQEADVDPCSRSASTECDTAAKFALRTWSYEKLRNIQHTSEVKELLALAGLLCIEAHKRNVTMTDKQLAIDLGRTFRRCFSGREVQAWRRDIATMSEHANHFLKNRDAIILFTNMDERKIIDDERITSMRENNANNPLLIITDSFFKDMAVKRMLQMMRAIALSTKRSDVLVFPIADNKDSTGPVTSSPSAFQDVEESRWYSTLSGFKAFCQAGIRLHRKLLSGQADADIDSGAVRLGNDTPDRKEALKALQRDARKIAAVIKSNRDSLVQYVCYSAFSAAESKRC